MYKIEKKFKRPVNASGYPFNEMDIDDSFSFETEGISRLRNAASNFKKKTGKKFLVSVTHMRCWRVS